MKMNKTMRKEDNYSNNSIIYAKTQYTTPWNIRAIFLFRSRIDAPKKPASIPLQIYVQNQGSFVSTKVYFYSFVIQKFNN